MKVTREKEDFRPITITIETEKDLAKSYLAVASKSHDCFELQAHLYNYGMTINKAKEILS